MIECGYGILLIQSVLYPFIYPFRIEKGRIGMFIGIFGIMGISSLFSNCGISFRFPQT